MTDGLLNLITGETVTEDIIEVTSDTPELGQVVTKALDGTVYIQNHGKISHRIVATILLDSVQDALLETAYVNANRVQLTNDDRIYEGYIIGIKPSTAYVDTYHTCQITIQEESV